jgi:hypothetical protein
VRIDGLTCWTGSTQTVTSRLSGATVRIGYDQGAGVNNTIYIGRSTSGTSIFLAGTIIDSGETTTTVLNTMDGQTIDIGRDAGGINTINIGNYTSGANYSSVNVNGRTIVSGSANTNSQTLLGDTINIGAGNASSINIATNTGAGDDIYMESPLITIDGTIITNGLNTTNVNTTNGVIVNSGTVANTTTQNINGSTIYIGNAQTTAGNIITIGSVANASIINMNGSTVNMNAPIQQWVI